MKKEASVTNKEVKKVNSKDDSIKKYQKPIKLSEVSFEQMALRGKKTPVIGKLLWMLERSFEIVYVGPSHLQMWMKFINYDI